MTPQSRFIEWLKLWGVTKAAITFDSDKGALLEVRGFRNALGLFGRGDHPENEFGMYISNEDLRAAGL